MQCILYHVLSIKGFLKLFLSFLLLTTYYLLLTTFAHAQGFNVASTYQVSDKDAVSGDILISAGQNGLRRTNVTYDSKIFGVLEDNPLIVLREASSSARSVIRNGDTTVNVTDFNGAIKKGDYITSSSILGKGMKAGQSGYVLGVALSDASFGDQTAQAQNKQVKLGTVKLAIQIQYAELTTARNTFALLNALNAAFFRSVQNPEQFTLTIRYIIAGLIALIAFTLGFFTVSRTITKGVEAMGRNPLARTSIMASVIFQLIITVIGALAAVGIIYIIVRI